MARVAGNAADVQLLTDGMHQCQQARWGVRRRQITDTVAPAATTIEVQTQRRMLAGQWRQRRGERRQALGGDITEKRQRQVP